jgi:hypothetical protein
MSRRLVALVALVAGVQFLTPATRATVDPSGDPDNAQTLTAPQPSQVDPDERFLDDLGLGGIRVTNVKEMIGDAHQICATLKAGETEQQIIKLAISQNATLTEANAQTLIESAEAVYRSLPRQPLSPQIGWRAWPVDLGGLKIAEEENAGLLFLCVDRALGSAADQVGSRDQQAERELRATRLGKEGVDVVLGDRLCYAVGLGLNCP